MKVFYVMIEADETFTTDSHIYKFKCGISAKDQRSMSVVQDYANKHGYYVAKYSLEVRDFCDKLAKSVERDFLQLNWVYLDVNELAGFIKNYNYTPRKTILTSNEIYTLRCRSLMYLN